MNKPKLTAAIVDDEQIARYGLRSYINRTPSLICVGEFKDTLTLNTYLRDNTPPDIIFMDIRMPEVSGLDFIASNRIESAVIIVSAFEQYALKGFELNVCDYLLKPVSYPRFLQAIDKALRYTYYRKGWADRDFLFIRADRILHRVYIPDIVYLESMENYVMVVTIAERIVTRSTFKALLSSLSHKGIVQIHKSYAVNLSMIKSIESNKIITYGDHILPLSRIYRDSLILP
ncbi:MAG: LytTR family DNA-binding domain-containing protein [Muribaculaceae bacterium]|nr:LytTR family DNA-binding domain-containing protein [Muribaculaceae bacterium]